MNSNCFPWLKIACHVHHVGMSPSACSADSNQTKNERQARYCNGERILITNVELASIFLVAHQREGQTRGISESKGKDYRDGWYTFMKCSKWRQIISSTLPNCTCKLHTTAEMTRLQWIGKYHVTTQIHAFGSFACAHWKLQTCIKSKAVK